MGEPARIDLCGDLVVAADDEVRTAELPGRQGRLAVAYLALHRAKPVSRDALVAAIWGEEDPREHGQALSVVLSKVRRALGPGRLETTGAGGLRLSAEVAIDFEAAEATLQQAAAARADHAWEAAALAAGRVVATADRGLLGGLDADWLDEPRRRLETMALEARELIVHAGLACGGARLATAARSAAELVERAPFRESGYVLLMRVREAEGNVAEALRVYDQLRGVLREELGVAPGPRAQAELERLLRNDGPEPAEAAPVAERPFFATRSNSAFVGRRQELERLWSVYSRAAAGGGQVVLVEGEPGIGKTRLAIQAMARCEAAGALVLYGRCDPESLVPYQPFLEALRHAAARMPEDRLRAWSQLHGRELARVIPELGGGDRPAPAGDEDTARYRLFEAVAQAIIDIARSQPVVLVLDDLHWADRPTLMLLRQLARSAEDAPLLVLATYRDTERPRELVDALVHLRREHFLEQIRLQGLDADDAAALVESLGVTGTPGLWEETRGNPFFLEEMARHIEARGGGDEGLPEGVREVIGRRLDALSEQTHRVLGHAAVIGREFDLDTLEAVGPARGDELDDVVDEGVRTQLIAEMPGVYGRISFTHALIRQTLYEGLTFSRRARLHLRVGEALEEAGASEREAQLAELAHHFALAPPSREGGRAAGYAERAARHAAGVLAYEEAARLYRLALAHAGDDLPRRAELLLARGDAQTKAGELEGAHATFLEAADAARALGSPALLAQATLGFGAARQMFSGVVDATVVALLEEALAAVGHGDAPLRTRLLARLAMELSFAGQRERRAAISTEAVALARTGNDLKGLGLALVARHWSLWGPDNGDERLAITAELLRLADLRGDDRLAAQGHRWRMMDLLETGAIAEADAEIDALAELVEARGRVTELPYVPLFRAMRLLVAGRFDEAEAASRDALRLAERIGGDTNVEQAHVLQSFILRRERGGLESLEETAIAFASRYHSIPGWRCLLACLHALIGRRESARAALDELSAGGFAVVPVDGLWLCATGLLVEATAAAEARGHAETLYALLLPHADRNVALGWGSACMGPVARHLALLAALAGRRDDAAGHFEAAIAMNERMGARAWLARTRYEYGRLLAGGAGAAEQLELAGAEAEALGMPLLAAQVRTAGHRPQAGARRGA